MSKASLQHLQPCMSGETVKHVVLDTRFCMNFAYKGAWTDVQYSTSHHQQSACVAACHVVETPFQWPAGQICLAPALSGKVKGVQGIWLVLECLSTTDHPLTLQASQALCVRLGCKDDLLLLLTAPVTREYANNNMQQYVHRSSLILIWHRPLTCECV